MTPLLVKAYFMRVRRSSPLELAKHFGIDQSLGRMLIAFWEVRGKVMQQSCGGCQACFESAVYQWID